MASSSTSSIRKNFKYHVFISFRGEDVRTTFVDHLYHSLRRSGIHTFRDNEGLEKGKRIDELFKAIEESKFFIIVFSKDYASSSWCLKELAKIMECQDETERIAYPLFYDVEPADIRKQRGPVGRAMAKHKNDKEIIKTWKKAMEDAGNLVGWDLKKIANGHEAEAIDQIVKKVSVKLRSLHVSKDENLVGMESRMQNLEVLLGKGLDDEVRMIGIKGMGGIGKTTLATAIFHEISSQFDGISFVKNVREVSKAQGLLSLQQQVLKDVFSIEGVQDAISTMKDLMPLKKVLLVLDDVDHKEQLEALAGDWFKGGSRIIITTRDEQVLNAHRVKMIHDIDFLSDEEAISLFCRYAFERYIPIPGYEDLSFKVVKYAAYLPLTLKVLGSFLLGKEKAVWVDTLDRLKEIPEKETLDKLEISYDSLEADQKEIFLDVACFMNGMWIDDVIRTLQSRGFRAITGLKVLQDRSLITFSNDFLRMHDSIQELGRHIVRRSHPNEPNKHSRLWISEEIEAVLSDDVGTDATTCIRLEWTDLSPEIIMKGLRNLMKLRFLHILERGSGPRDNRMFDQDTFPNALRYLKWQSYPGRSLPQTFRANNLVGLELPFSKIMQLWENGEQKVLSNLRFLNLRDSKLTTLDLRMTRKLERLDLYGCRDLTEIHACDGCLKSLVYLNLIGCSSFKSSSFIQQLESPELPFLPNLKVSVESFQEKDSDNKPKLSFECYYFEEQTSLLEISQKSVSVDLERGTKLDNLFGVFFGLQYLRHLTIRGPIRELPNDLDRLANLEELNLYSPHIKCLPDSICMMKKLKSLKLKSCELLEELPRDLGHLVCLEKLTLKSERLKHRIKHLPDSICMMENLKSLKLEACELLEELPRDLGQLVCLEKLTLKSEQIKHLPDSFCMLKNLKSLKLIHCCNITELPTDLDQLVCLEKLTLWTTRVEHLPDSICRMKNLKSLELGFCVRLKKLPEDIGQLECLEKLILTECRSLKDIPTSICNLTRLRYFSLPLCKQIKNLPEELGSLEFLEELDISYTRISHLPQSISSLEGLRVVGSEEVLRSCVFGTEIQYSGGKTFCYIQAVDNTEVETELENQFTENNSNRWRWSMVVVVLVLVLVVGLLVRQVICGPTQGRATWAVAQGSKPHDFFFFFFFFFFIYTSLA